MIKMSSRTLISWRGMMARCYNKNDPYYSIYGGRGIKVCERWLTFTKFLEDMGERPEGKSVDRYPDNNGNYEPGNCRWATPKEQANNKRGNRIIEFNGEQHTVCEWAEITGITESALRQRIASKRSRWTIENSLTLKVHTNKMALKRSKEASLLKRDFLKSEVFNCVRLNAPISSTSVANKTALPARSVRRYLSDLVKEKKLISFNVKLGRQGHGVEYTLAPWPAVPHPEQKRLDEFRSIPSRWNHE